VAVMRNEYDHLRAGASLGFALAAALLLAVMLVLTA
jgi:hypothetical protein